jgi:hypothetical protein
MKKSFWLAMLAYLLPSFPLGYAWHLVTFKNAYDRIESAARFAGIFALLSWSYMTLSVAAKYQMSSVTDFLKLESAFTLIQFAIVSPLIALANRGAPADTPTGF